MEDFVLRVQLHYNEGVFRFAKRQWLGVKCSQYSRLGIGSLLFSCKKLINTQVELVNILGFVHTWLGIFEKGDLFLRI